MQKQQPNILLIMSDQHRYDCVGHANGYPVKTPNIDALAEKGIWFEHAYSTIPTCCPARQSLICGKRPERFGALWNYDITLPIPALPPDDFSYAKALKKAGYSTGYLGKWHVSGEHDPTEYGFDSYDDYDLITELRKRGLLQGGFFSGSENQRHKREIMLGATSPLPLEEAPTHVLASRAVDLIKSLSEKDQPFHVVLSFTEPHLPCMPSGKFAEMYKKEDTVQWGSFEDTFENKPYIQRQQLLNWGFEDMTWEDWSECVARYYGIISQTDEAIGAVVSAVEQMGLAEDTVIIYTSDHGDTCGSHKMIDKHYIMYDDVVRVPFVMRWDGHYAPRTCRDFVHNFLDLNATMLELAGAEKPEITDGKSLLSQLSGQDEGREYAVSTYNGQQFGLFCQRMIRNAGYKYIWNLTDVDEFYDLESDPHELKNAIYKKKYADVIALMRHQLYDELKKCGDRIVSNWTEDQLLQGRKI